MSVEVPDRCGGGILRGVGVGLSGVWSMGIRCLLPRWLTADTGNPAPLTGVQRNSLVCKDLRDYAGYPGRITPTRIRQGPSV